MPKQNATLSNIGNRLLNAYFTDFAAYSLNGVFKSCVTELAAEKSESDATYISRIVVSLLLVTLVEHGHLSEYKQFLGTEGQNINKLCDVVFFPQYCMRLGRFNDYQTWTHMILYFIMTFRSGQFPDMKTTKKGANAVNIRSLDDSVDTDFISDAILLLYCFLFMRLVVAAQNLPGAKVRYNLEACFFLVIISFYFDYTWYTKNFVYVKNYDKWELMLNQIRTKYMKKGKFFVTLSLKHNRETYLQQDIITSVYSCLNSHFLTKYKGLLLAQNYITEPDIYPAITCLHNMNFNSISIKTSRWLRGMIYNKYTKGINTGVRTVYSVKSYVGNKIAYVSNKISDISNSTTESFELGLDVYDAIYTDRFPSASTKLGFVVGMIAFTASLFGKYAITVSKAQLAAQYAAVSYIFRKEDLVPQNQKTGRKVVFEQAKRPAYLAWERSKDGNYSVVYNISPTPKAVYDPIKGYTFNNRGGSTKRTSRSRSKSATTKREQNVQTGTDVAAFTKAIKNGFVKQVLPLEQQNYIRQKLKTMKIRGGGADSISVEDFVGIETDDVPDNHTRMIIDVADVAPFAITNEDGMVRFVFPKPQMEKEALENAEYKNIVDPMMENMSKQKGNILYSVKEKTGEKPDTASKLDKSAKAPEPPFVPPKAITTPKEALYNVLSPRNKRLYVSSGRRQSSKSRANSKKSTKKKRSSKSRANSKKSTKKKRSSKGRH